MSIELKIKMCSLAAELRVIKQNEQRLKRKANPRKYAQKMGSKIVSEEQRQQYRQNKQERIAKLRATQWSERIIRDFQSIYNHRKQGVAPEARAAHLACMFIKGRAYHDCEYKYHPGNAPDIDRITRIVSTFSAMFDFDGCDNAARKETVRQWTLGVPPFRGWVLNTGTQPEHNGMVDVLQEHSEGPPYFSLNNVAGDLAWNRGAKNDDSAADNTGDGILAWRPHVIEDTPAT